MTYKEKFLAWFEKEKAENGLISVRAALDPFTAFDVDEHMDSLDESVYEDLVYVVENWEDMETVVSVSPLSYKEKLEKFLAEEKKRGVTYSFTRNLENKDYDEEEACKELYLSIKSASYGHGTPIEEL